MSDTLLATGQLLPVAAIAELVLGAPVHPNTALRWATAGRDGVRLPTRRGRRRARVTTEAAFRWWLTASDGTQTATPVPTAPLPAHEADVLRRLGLAS
jgi:hypothetical protein